jgi:hypothetical protein
MRGTWFQASQGVKEPFQVIRIAVGFCPVATEVQQDVTNLVGKGKELLGRGLPRIKQDEESAALL